MNYIKYEKKHIAAIVKLDAAFDASIAQLSALEAQYPKGHCLIDLKRRFIEKIIQKKCDRQAAYRIVMVKTFRKKLAEANRVIAGYKARIANRQYIGKLDDLQKNLTAAEATRLKIVTMLKKMEADNVH
ncbi:MAG: hypothetical protein WC510_02045 [Candidatus Omnitrophota bacterium]